jgi:hypothetical protein
MEIFEKSTLEVYNTLLERKVAKLITIKENLEKTTVEQNEN